MSTRVRESAADNWAARTVNVQPGNAPSLIAAADAGRRAITVVNIGTVPVFVSHVQAVDGTNGFQLAVGAGYEFKHTKQIFGFLAPGEVAAGLVNTLTESGES